MATPLRMQMHLQGKRHCEAVARRYLRGVSRNAMPDASSAAEALRQHSQAPLANALPEPPDVAVAAVTAAFEKQS